MHKIEKRTLAPAVVLVVLASVTACRSNTFSGELGRAEFSWGFCAGSTPESLPDCNHDAPALASGAIAQLGVGASDTSSLPAFDVSSTDASILTFSIIPPGWIQVSAIAKGTAKLVLVDRATGDDIDRLSLTVEDPATIAISSPIAGWSLTMMKGPLEFEFALHDAAGDPLIATGAITYAPDPGIAVEPGTAAGTSDDAILVSTTASGTAAISLTAGAASARLQIVTVQPDDVARVVIPGFDARYLSELGDTWGIEARALLGDGSVVYSPQLSWASSNPACLRIEAPPMTDDEDSDAQLRVMGTACTARISASVGAAADSIDIAMN